MSWNSKELRVLANQAKDRNWEEADVDTLVMSAAEIERLEAKVERLADENAALRAEVERLKAEPMTLEEIDDMPGFSWHDKRDAKGGD